MATATLHDFPVANLDVASKFLASSVRDDIHIVIVPPDGPPHGDQPKPYGRWFGADAEGAAKWALAENAKGYGAYWTVNITRRHLDKKPKKADMLGARYLHVDIDPPFDRAEVLEALVDGRVPPSFVIDSGNGLQALWRLEYAAENMPVIEGLNQSLEDMFGGDHCFNIDRLLRLPGSVNYPNKLKRSKGRIPALASIEVADAGESVDPEHMRLVLPPPRARQDTERATVDLGGLKIVTLDELGITTLNRLHVAIVEPRNPDRSNATFNVACEMVRQGFSDAQIAGVLLNPNLAISGHCLDQPSALRAARRAIGSARAVTANEQPRERQDDRAGTAAGGSSERGSLTEGEKPLVSATPYRWREPEAIKPREWVYGRSIQRGHLRAVVAQGGAGKTILSVGEALAMATGRDILGQPVPGGPKRVWLWNLEDDGEELARIIQAACIHWKISEADLDGRLFVDSALDGAILKLARSSATGGLVINRPLVAALTDEMLARGIDYLHVDPFVSSHAANENDNMEIDAIAKEWAMVAKNANAGIGLAHHISKAGSGEATAMHARGAVALINACRSVMVLNRMSEDEATRYCIEAERRRRFFRVYDDKNNRAPPSDDSDWYQMWSVNLGNAEDGEGDSMGVVVPWPPPDAFDGVTASHLYRVQQMIDEGEWRANWQGKPWAGEAVGQVLGIDSSVKANRLRIIKLLKDWTDNGALAVVEKKDGTRQMRPFIIVGEWAVDGAAPLKPSVAVHSGAVEQPKRAAPPTPLIGGGGVAGGAGGPNSVVRTGAALESDCWHANPTLGRPRGPRLAPGESLDDPVPGWE